MTTTSCRDALDGGAPRLRLITGGRPTNASGDPPSGADRRRYTDVRAWALERGHPVELEALDVLFGAMDDDELIDGVPPSLWTEARVLEFVWTTALFWCHENDLDPPAGLAETLDAWLCFLDEIDSFAAGSDPLAVLRRALRSSTDLQNVRTPVAERPAS